MKIIITEDKRNRSVTHWLNTFYGDLEKHYSYGHKYEHYRDNGGKDVFIFNSNTGVVELSNDIVNQLVSMFHIDNGYDINDIFIPWLEERYNLHVERVIYFVILKQRNQ